MTAVIRFYSLKSDSELLYAQFDEELGRLAVPSFKDKSERTDCVNGSGLAG